MIGLICGAVGGWCILAALGATVPHRAKRHRPPAPTPPPPSLQEQFDAIVAGPWFDGAIHYTGHTHGRYES